MTEGIKVNSQQTSEEAAKVIDEYKQRLIQVINEVGGAVGKDIEQRLTSVITRSQQEANILVSGARTRAKEEVDQIKSKAKNDAEKQAELYVTKARK